MATSKKNIYAFLLDETPPEDEHQETTQTQRKALKKLREISLLKAKPHKTPEEYAKINQESFYRLIANTVDANTVDANTVDANTVDADVVDKEDHTIEEARLRKSKKQEYEHKLRAKDKKIAALQAKLHTQEVKLQTQEAKLQTQEAKNQEKKKLFYKTISDQAKTISQQCRQIDEMNSVIHMLHNQTKNIKNANIFHSILFDEYNTALQKAHSTRTPLQVWKKIMLKYHPDKLAHILGTRMSTEIANLLTEMKPES